MKKFISVCLSLLIVFSASTLLFDTAIAVSEEDFSYVLLDNNTAEIDGYFGEDTVLTIPSKIDGYKVTSIGAWVFDSCESFIKVTIPSGVTKIDEGAFSCCSGLTDISIPKTVTYIGSNVFSDCTSLEKIVLPAGVTSIGEYVFSDCTKLKEVTFPDNIKSLEEGMFFDCEGLTEMVIPTGVTDIKDFAFYNCANLSSVTIPKSVSNIGEGAFDECPLLTDVYYGGDETAWNNILIGEWNSYLTDATIHYTSSPITGTTDFVGEESSSLSSESPESSSQSESIGTDPVNSSSNEEEQSSQSTPINTDPVDSSSNEEEQSSQSTPINTDPENSSQEVSKNTDPSEKLPTTTSPAPKKTSISLAKSSGSVYVKGTVNIKATVKNGKGKTTYKSSNDKIAKVSTKGTVTGLKKGSAKIYVTNNGVKKTFTVTVKNPYLNKQSLKLKPKKSYTLKITGKIGKATFKSSNKKIATVSSKGKVVAKKKGSTYITVKSNGITLKCKVRVY
ncbi:MAG: leucine-rich repeat protein [Acutalibacteraceae bacterium]